MNILHYHGKRVACPDIATENFKEIDPSGDAKESCQCNTKKKTVLSGSTPCRPRLAGDG